MGCGTREIWGVTRSVTQPVYCPAEGGMTTRRSPPSGTAGREKCEDDRQRQPDCRCRKDNPPMTFLREKKVYFALFESKLLTGRAHPQRGVAAVHPYRLGPAHDLTRQTFIHYHEQL